MHNFYEAIYSQYSSLYQARDMDLLSIITILL